MSRAIWRGAFSASRNGPSRSTTEVSTVRARFRRTPGCDSSSRVRSRERRNVSTCTCAGWPDPTTASILGLWSFVPTRELVIPLDTHIYRIGRHLGWTERRTPGFRAALDITRSLARFDAEDPVKYDFALSRLGILEDCPRHRRALHCGLCELVRRSRAA